MGCRTPEQEARRRAKRRARRAAETPEQKAKRRARRRAGWRALRAAETPAARKDRQAQDAAAARASRAVETPAVRAARLAASRERSRKWRQTPEGKAKSLAAKKRWGKTEKGLASRRAREATHTAHKLQQTPAWADRAAILQVYQDCPEGFEVDHVIPLRGRKVRGLHVAANLQHLAAAVNRDKGNRYAPRWEVLRPDLLQPERKK